MATVRLNITGSEYRKQLKGIENEKKALEARIKARAEELCKLYPSAPIGMGAVAREITKFTTINTLTYIHIIEAIEKYMEEQHPHKQTKINF